MKNILLAVDDTRGSKEAVSSFARACKCINPDRLILLHVEKLEGRSLIDEMLGDPEMATLKAAQTGTADSLATTQGELVTTQEELATTQEALAATQAELDATQDDLVLVQDDLDLARLCILDELSGKIPGDNRTGAAFMGVTETTFKKWSNGLVPAGGDRHE